MILDARSLEGGVQLDYDLCIIGAGAAGITIALELAALDLRICLLESGGEEFDPDTQSLYGGTVDNEDYPGLEANRLRYFGGTTNHWAGNTQIFSPFDFEARDWIPLSGWPFPRDTLIPYYQRAHRYLELPAPDYRVEHIFESTSLKPLPLPTDLFAYDIGFRSPPTRFGEVYRETLAQAKRVDVYLNANVTEIVAAEDGQSISHLDCAVLDGPTFTTKATRYVLATGGIENARMLLASNSVHRAGLGNAHDVVGRYFMDHPIVGGGIFYPSIPREQVQTFLGPAQPREGAYATLRLTEEVMRQKHLAGVRLPMLTVTRYYASEGIEAYHALADSWREQFDKGELWDDLVKIFGDLEMVAEAMSRRLFDTRLFDSANDRDFYFFDCMLEQVPDPDNRVMLIDERDELGLPRVEVNWRITDLERRSVWETCRLLGEQLGAAGLGRLRILLDQERVWTNQLGFGHHHCGATRMGEDVRTSVVDSTQRVHDLANLYIAGGSVFPTCGHVPVTHTVVATSIRLADHLRSTMRT